MVTDPNNSKESAKIGTGKRTVLLVDDHPVVCRGLAGFINHESDFVVCGVAQTGAEVTSSIATLNPDIVVLDLALPRSHGLELLKDIHVQYPRLRVLIYSSHDEAIYAERALRAGARGYVMKQQPLERLLEGMRTVLNGGYALSRDVSASLLCAFRQSGDGHPKSLVANLGNRELEVFEFIGQGKGTREIAGQLGLSAKTIETYRQRIKEKLNVQSAGDLVRQAVCWVETET
jgi:DNA-binding NarL/FixJ family response regulator